MKIRVAILEQDVGYLSRLSSAFGIKYGDKIEIYSFTDPLQASKALTEAKIDVFLVSDSFLDAYKDVPSRCGMAFLVNSSSVESIYGKPAICRFQKIDLIFKQIQNVYAENAQGIIEKGADGQTSNTRVLCFSSPAGGTGTSSVAVACALHLTSQNHRVLYLNLERFGSSEEYFSGEGSFNMSDVIYSLKSGKANLAIKLESCARRDNRGVYFYAAPKVSLDIMELTADDILRLLQQLCSTNNYDDIVMDIDFSVDNARLKVYGEADALIWTSDGSTTANEKLLRALAVFRIKEASLPYSLERKLNLIYNRFSNKSSVMLPEGTIHSLGGAPRFDHASTAQVIGKLTEKDFFDAIE